MSGKYASKPARKPAKKSTNKNTKHKGNQRNIKKKNTPKRSNRQVLIAIAACAVAVIGLLMLIRRLENAAASDPAQETTLPTASQQTQPTVTDGLQAETHTAPQTAPQNMFYLGSDVEITGFLAYTGAFMEDRTDEVVTDVLAIKVTNSGDKYIQTMNITLTAGDTQAEFSLSTLFPGETVIVLEKNRMAYSTAPAFEEAQVSSVALFDGHPGMCEDKVEVQCLNGVINVTNVSDEDITEDILIYYKNYIGGIYYGGITYRIRVEGGLKAGAIYQGSAAHFNTGNSTVVFVTCG